ncbi:tight adherence pilus pseudopilin TadF [Vibrio sp. HB161653]|nr:tight adherence pilus pseudopilin TadF [Vibrio sp. HB161653]MDP5253168.1 tight adherence pilus pseudopilin TadF [Vibrio sp. HB161653]
MNKYTQGPYGLPLTQGWRRQDGSFAIELAFVLFGLCAIFMFGTDLSKQLLIRASLDRTSFSLVNVLKERTRYYDGEVSSETNLIVTASNLSDMQTVGARLLDMSSDDVAIQIQSMVDGTVTTLHSDQFDQYGCVTDDFSDYSDLVPEDDGTVYPLYRVSLCEQFDSWFLAFLGDDDTNTILSSSIIVGR